jgi:hypothetical protein
MGKVEGDFKNLSVEETVKKLDANPDTGLT